MCPDQVYTCKAKNQAASWPIPLSGRLLAPTIAASPQSPPSHHHHHPWAITTLHHPPLTTHDATDHHPCSVSPAPNPTRDRPTAYVPSTRAASQTLLPPSPFLLIVSLPVLFRNHFSYSLHYISSPPRQDTVFFLNNARDADRSSYHKPRLGGVAPNRPPAFACPRRRILRRHIPA